jgi:hypothetical protein
MKTVYGRTAGLYTGIANSHGDAGDRGRVPGAKQICGPALCERCHTEIANNFRKTGMGRSFSRLQPGNAAENLTLPGKPFYHKASDSYFAMVLRDGRYYQRRWQKGFDGAETNAGTPAQLVCGERRVMGNVAVIRPAGLSRFDAGCDLGVHVLS